MARKKGKGRAVKRARQKFGLHYESEEVKLAPHTMVFSRGDPQKLLRRLVKDVRKVMEPYTAINLKTMKKNTLKDFISIAGPLHVTHLIVFSETDVDSYMKIMRLPRGPTLHFRLEEISLCTDVLSSIKKPSINSKLYLHQPLLVLNGFNINPAANTENDESKKFEMHHKLMASMFQNMFASINVTKVDLNQIKRCVMFNYNKEDDTIDFRQYCIKLAAVGLSKPTKKLIQERIPDLSNLNDISEYFEKSGLLSESEAEFDAKESEVTLPKDVNSRGSVNLKDTKSAIRLVEMGPRMKMTLFKIEEGVCEGKVLYHSVLSKAPEQINEIRESLKQKKRAEKKIIKKSNKKNANKNAKKKEEEGESSSDEDAEVEDTTFAPEDNENDDAEYYKQEVGLEPDADFFNKAKGKKRKNRREESDEFLTMKDIDMAEKKKDKDDDDDLPDRNKNKKQKIVRFNDTKVAKNGIKNNKNNNNNKTPKQKPFLRFSNKKKQILKNK